MVRLLLKDLTPDTLYKLQLRAVGEDVVSEWSPLLDLLTTDDSDAPDVPQWASSNDWVTNGDTFVANWLPLDFNLNQNKDFNFYEIELGDGSVTRIVRTTNTNYTLTFNQNVIFFGSAKPVVTARIRSVDNVGNASAWNALKTANNQPPAAPTNVGVAVGVNSLSVTWTPSTDTDVLYHRVYVGTSAGFVPSSANRIFEGVANRTTYTIATSTPQFFKIRAVDKFNQESADLTSTGHTPDSPFLVDTTSPDTPTFVTGNSSIANNANGIGSKATLEWTLNSPPPSDLAGFYVRYRKSGDTVWISAQFPKDHTSIDGVNNKHVYKGEIELQLAHQNYQFQIKAFDWSNNESAWSGTMTLISPTNQPPSDVGPLSTTGGVSANAIRYTWPAIADADLRNYEVTFSPNATFGDSDDITFLTGTANTLTVGGLVPGTTYRARVRAVDAAGLTSANWSATKTDTTTAFFSDSTPPASSPAANVSPGIGYLFVTWSPVSNNDPVTYEIHISTVSGFTPNTPSPTKVAETSATSIILEQDAGGSSLAYGTTYFVRIIAKDKDGAAAVGNQGSGSPSKAAVSDIVQLNITDILDGVSTTQLNSSLNGKNKITFSTVAPVNGTDTGILGDTWYVRPSGPTGQITAVYELSTAPSTWTQRPINGLAVDNLDAGRITAGFLNADRIGANTITTEKLVVADINNLAPNYGFDLSEYRAIFPLTGVSTHNYINDTAGYGDILGYSIKVDASAGSSLSLISSNNRVAPGDSVYISWQGKRVNADFVADVVLRLYDKDNVVMSTLALTPSSSTPTVSDTNNTWKLYEGTVVIPANVQYARVAIRDAVGTTGSWRIDNVTVRRANRGLMIVDGTLLATALKTSTLNAATITLDASGILKTANNEVTLNASGIFVTGSNSQIVATALTTGTFQSGNVLTVNGNMLLNGNMQVQTGGYIKSTEYTGTTQASNPSGLGWYLGRDGLRISSGIVSANSLGPGTVGGPNNTGIIDIAAGASIRTNGGAIVANEYGGTTYNASATAGFFIGRDGSGNFKLHIPQGEISASTLTTGTVSAASINLTSTGEIKSGGYVDGTSTTGFRLSVNGLEIPNGALSAQKIKLSNGSNLITSQFADFEFSASYYNSTNMFRGGVTTIEVRTDGGFTNTQYIRHGRTGTTGVADTYLGPSATSYIYPVEAGQTYTYSFYAKGHPTTAVNVTAGFRWSNAAFTTTAVTIPSGSGWTRYSITGTAPAGVTGTAFLQRITTLVDGLYYDLDSVQLEATTFNSPVSWRPPGTTLIDGNQIRTGEIRSSNTLSVGGNVLPYWIIDTQGSAQFSNLLVRGASVVGAADAEGSGSFIQSFNYQVGESGWIIRSDGYAEFRQLASDSINGEVIQTGTLYADAIGPGALNDVIRLEGGMEAKGLAGETVGLTGEDGFYVIGSPEIPIASYAIDGTTGNVTINTSGNHGINVGDNVRFSDVLNTQIVNGTYYVVTSKVDDDTFVFNIPGATTVATTTITGTVYGGASENKNTPTLVSFPTDGSRPNILSGTLEASTLIVSKAGSFQGAMNIEPSAEIVIASGITNPKVVPTLNATLDKKTWNLRSGRSWITLTGLTVGHDNHFYGVGPSYDTLDVISVRVLKFERNVSNTGTQVASLTLSGRAAGQVHGIVYSGGSYWVLTSTNVIGTNNREFKITKYSTSWVSGGTTTLFTLANSDFKGATLGIDHSATDTILVATMQPSISGVRVRPYVTTTGSAVAGTASTIGAFLAGKTNPVFIARGNFDYGSGRYVVKFKSDKTYYAITTAGAESAVDHWQTYSPTTSAAGWDTVDSRFLEINDVTGAYVYNSGASMWSSTDKARKFWVGYSWYDGTNNTQMSPSLGVELKKRRFLQVTVPDIPKGGAGTPDRARIWVQQTTNQPAGTGSGWKLRGTITHPQKTIYVDFITTPGATEPSATNTFSADGAEAIIRTSDNNSFWKGDNSAQFYKLVLLSDQNASRNFNNAPALRIGNVNGTHLRVGDNGIYALSDNANPTATTNGFNLVASLVSMNVDNGFGIFESGTNINFKMRSLTDTHSALVLRAGGVVAGIATYNSNTATSANTVTFTANDIHAYGSFFDETLVGGGTTAADINNSGRIIRGGASSLRYKTNVAPMTIDVARLALGLESVSFQLLEEVKSVGPQALRYPGFIAEQAHASGARLWINYNEKGEPDGFRYAELTAAHNMLIKELYQKVSDLETINRALAARIEALGKK